jgi:hypothetical protein
MAQSSADPLGDLQGGILGHRLILRHLVGNGAQQIEQIPGRPGQAIGTSASAQAHGGGWSNLWRLSAPDRWAWFIRKKLELNTKSPLDQLCERIDSRIHPIHVFKDRFRPGVNLGLLIALRKTGCVAVQEVVNCLTHLVSRLFFGTPIVNFFLFAFKDREQIDCHLLDTTNILLLQIRLPEQVSSRVSFFDLGTIIRIWPRSAIVAWSVLLISTNKAASVGGLFWLRFNCAVDEQREPSPVPCHFVPHCWRELGIMRTEPSNVGNTKGLIK